MKQMIRVPLAALALTASLSAPLLADETVTQCQNRVITECAATMEGENFATRVVLGIACTARIFGCSAIHFSINAS